MKEDTDHPIIQQPWRYTICDMRYHTGHDGSEPFLDLTLASDTVTRRLRFLSPRQLIIEEGFPSPTHGMQILDVRSRQLDGIGIRVADFEASHGAITFWAREVVDLDQTESAS